METMNVQQVVKLLGTEERIFLNDRKRFEKTLINKGCVFTTEGKGKNALYHFTHISKEAKQMELAKQWETTFGFKPKRPYAAISYLFFITHESRAAFMSDSDIAYEFYGNKELRPIISMAREDLTKAGILKPLKATETGYFLGNEQVDKDMYSTAWHYFFERLGFHAAEIEKWEAGLGGGSYTEHDKEVQKAAGQIARMEMEEEWGAAKKIQKRELTGKGWTL